MSWISNVLVLAAEEGSNGTADLTLMDHVAAVLIYSVIGLVVFAIAFWLMQKLCPFSVQKEIEEDQNTSLAIIMGSVMIGISIIIAAAVHG